MLKATLLGWKECSLDVYKQAFAMYGGSVCCHPDVITYLSNKLGKEVKYFCKTQDDILICASYSIQGGLCLFSRDYPFVYEDIIIPCNLDGKVILPFRTKKMSPKQTGFILNSFSNRLFKNKICHIKQNFSSKTSRKRNGERNRFIKAGGEILNIESLSTNDICDAYLKLFRLRWKDKLRPFPEENLFETIERFRHMLFGAVLTLNDKIIAVDLIFKTEAIDWVYFDDINGGYDPSYSDLSVGSILLWENYNRAKELCQVDNKKLIFSLGKYREEWKYKKAWCEILPLRRTIC
ncbi:GNAT family N-acetyltransferase [Enterobacter sp. UPMP2052]